MQNFAWPWDLKDDPLIQEYEKMHSKGSKLVSDNPAWHRWESPVLEIYRTGNCFSWFWKLMTYFFEKKRARMPQTLKKEWEDLDGIINCRYLWAKEGEKCDIDEKIFQCKQVYTEPNI